MFPMIAQASEFSDARDLVLEQVERHRRAGRPAPAKMQIGAMLETPSLAFAPNAFFGLADFISIGGNDLKQFFFAADRENERVRRRYDTLNSSYLSFISLIVERCANAGTPLSYCGEDAGRPLEAAALCAMGLRTLSMRPASIGPIKRLVREIRLDELRRVIEDGIEAGEVNLRGRLLAWASRAGAPLAP
jgi:phosphotransferase system enzyme I (PtsP)